MHRKQSLLLSNVAAAIPRHTLTVRFVLAFQLHAVSATRDLSSLFFHIQVSTFRCGGSAAVLVFARSFVLHILRGNSLLERIFHFWNDVGPIGCETRSQRLRVAASISVD